MGMQWDGLGILNSILRLMNLVRHDCIPPSVDAIPVSFGLGTLTIVIVLSTVTIFAPNTANQVSS
jgi:hypothetical protein